MRSSAKAPSENSALNVEKSNQHKFGSLSTKESRSSSVPTTNDGSGIDGGKDRKEGAAGNQGSQKLQLPDKIIEVSRDYCKSTEADNSKCSPQVHWHLFAAAGAGAILFIGAGCAFGWASPSQDFFVTKGFIDSTTWSWIAAMNPLGGILSPIPMGYFTDKYGRKPCGLGAGALFLISWAMIGFAKGAPMLLGGRFLGGIATGATTTVIPLYINEITTNSMRSTLNTFLQFSMSSGLLVAYSVGPYYEPVVLAAVCSAIPAIFLIAFLPLPESPYVLAEWGDLKEASKSLAWLRGQSESDVQKELAIIQIVADRANAQKGPFFQKVATLFRDKATRKAFLLSLALVTCSQGSGITAVSYYAQSIFQATKSGMDPAISAIIMGVMKLIATVGCVAFTRCISMKSLLLVSAIGMAIGHGILGFYFYEEQQGVDISEMSYVPLVCLIILVLFFCVGFGPIPYALATELLGAGDVKATAMAINTTYVWAVAFLITSQFSSFMRLVGAAGAFASLGAFCLLSAIFAMVFVPNTRNKSIQEIRDLLDK